MDGKAVSQDLSTLFELRSGSLHRLESGEASRVNEDSKIWEEYYQSRSRARLSLVAFVIAAWILPIALAILLRNRSTVVQIAAFFIAMVVAGVAILGPVFTWAKWKCPRCKKKFSEPQRKFVLNAIWLLPPVLWRLVAGSRCASCKLRCGESPEVYH